MKDKTKIVSVRENECFKDGYKYEYQLLMKKSRKVASYRLPLYSVKIKLTDPEGNITEEELSDVFSDIGKAIVFYQRLVDCLVTPIDLPYILEDEILI